MGGPGSGAKSRVGRKRKVSGGRAWMRSIVDSPERRIKFLAAVDQALAEGNPSPFIQAFTHGYGNAPQALDISGIGEPTPGKISVQVFEAPMITAADVRAKVPCED